MIDRGPTPRFEVKPMYPKDYRYSKEHEWVKIEGATATLGITDFAQKELGDIVFLELAEVGRKLEPGSILGTVESVKAVSEIYCPVEGEIVERNTKVIDHPEALNQDPHGKAWLVKIKLAPGADASGLMDATAYDALVAKSAH
jgi:glycine cleavage system H protein